MRQRGYLIAFVLVLLTACVGGFFGGRFLIRRLQQDFGSQATWAPPTASPPSQTGDATPVATANARLTASPAGGTQPVLATPIRHPYPGHGACAARCRNASLRRDAPRAGTGADTDRD